MVQSLLDKYNYTTVPTATIVGMLVSFIVAIALPIVLLIIWKKKSGAKVSMFFLGALTFIASALIVESIVNNIIFKLTNNALTNNIWLYAVVGGIMAGLFEAVGRYIFMNCFMKGENLCKKNGIMHGIGHGGIESIILIGVAQVSNIATAVLINSGLFATTLEQSASLLSADVVEQSIAQTSALWAGDSYLFYLSGIERISAIALHISMSYLVYRAVKDKKITKLFAAIGIHALFDFTAAILSNFFGAVATEIALIAFSAVVSTIVIKAYRSEQEDEPMAAILMAAENNNNADEK
ncbi:MAG: YhfC family intramembrane metalloprotease [Lachnospiraceae bacterium]|nr:YhfC family intramembrane metalloprotease [Lachnospiraceae bacterium]